jgi:hypothetical protein
MAESAVSALVVMTEVFLLMYDDSSCSLELPSNHITSVCPALSDTLRNLWFTYYRRALPLYLIGCLSSQPRIALDRMVSSACFLHPCSQLYSSWYLSFLACSVTSTLNASRTRNQANCLGLEKMLRVVVGN